MSSFEEDNLNWIQDLEKALAEECTATEIYCICKGKSLPESLRSEVWQICLDVRDKGNQIELFDDIYDLPNQTAVRDACASFVSKLANDEDERPSIVSDLESIITFYCKSRHLQYEKDNGWIELLLPLITLKESKSTIYNLFEGICDTYIPQGSHKNGNVFHILRLLLLYHDPQLCSFLDTKKVTPDLYCLSWFQSLFAATCQLNVTIIMWDYYFQQSDPFFIFFLSLIMIINARDQIISMKDGNKDTLIELLSGMPSGLETEDVPDFCSLAQYYSLKTPASFRTDLMQVLYNGKKDVANHLISQALCLPVSVDELVENTFNSGGHVDEIRFFLVDCRPVEQYNAGHLPTAFHLDCTLMLQEPSAFQTAVQGLLIAQKQALAIQSNAAGEHLCFLGSGRNEEDQYTHMVVASFLQKHTKYVSMLTGGFKALHDCINFERSLQDHKASSCLVCLAAKEVQKSSTSKGSSKETSALFSKISAAMKSKSSEVKEMLFDYIVNPNQSPVQERHVSSNDKQGKRYRNVAPVFSIDDDHDNITSDQTVDDDSKECVSIQAWLKAPDVIQHFPCQEVHVSGAMYKSILVVTNTHLGVLREVTGKKDAAEVRVMRPLSSIVKITSRRSVPDLITFKYAINDGGKLLISDMDRFLIPNAKVALKILSEQISKEMS